jgi:hypothetical protein
MGFGTSAQTSFVILSGAKDLVFSRIYEILRSLHSLRMTGYTNDHFLTDTTKDEKWLVLVGRPSLAASRCGHGGPPHQVIFI